MTFNANGLRSAADKGFFDWFARQKTDVLCLQECRAAEDQLVDKSFRPRGYKRWFNEAKTKKGYSGVAIYAEAGTGRGAHRARLERLRRRGPLHRGALRQAQRGLAVPALRLLEGRAPGLQVQGHGLDRADLQQLAQRGSRVRDLRRLEHRAHADGHQNAKSNQKNSGFLPAERDWLTKLFKDHGWVDSYRHLHPEGQDYTWWSQRGAARAKNVGWRIDYQVVSPNLRERLKACAISPEPRFSDHAPYAVEFHK
jgi:exodeoxyribonuclease-3